MRSSYHLIWQLTLGQRLRYLVAMLAQMPWGNYMQITPQTPTFCQLSAQVCSLKIFICEASNAAWMAFW